MIFALAIGQTAAADNLTAEPALSDVVTRGGLSCFTITPLRYEGHSLPSCDRLCADHDAVCTTVQGNMNPQGCDMPSASSGQTCRCCAVAR